MDDLYRASKACCLNRYGGGGGDCVRWIVREVHVDRSRSRTAVR